MTEQDAATDGVTERLARLERQNRRLRWLFVAVAAAALSALVAPAAIQAAGKPGKVAIEGDKLVLRNGDGKTVGFFGIDRDGYASLGFLDKNAKLRSTIGMDAEGNPAFVLLDGQANVRVTLAQSGQTAAFLLFDKEKTPRLTATIEADGSTNFGLVDAKGKESWKAQ